VVSAFGVALSMLLAACTGAEGPKGDKGDPGVGTPSVSAVTPTSAFLARTLDVTISGSNSAWTDKATADFGADVKVEKVVVASPSALVATITVAATAALGPRDVTVRDGDASATFKGAFKIEAPLKITTTGTLAQGSVVSVRARGLDFETPFDTTATGDGLFTPLTFTNIAVSGPAGTNTNVDNVSDYVVDYTLLVDVTAPPATVDVSIDSGPSGDTLSFPYPAAFKIAARTPKTAAPNATTTDMLANAGDSALFMYTPSSATLKILDLTTTATDANASPAAYFLPKSGKFADAFAASSATTQVISSTDPIYAVAVDTGGYGGYAVGLKVDETAATAGTDKEPNNSDTDATANGAVTLPFAVQGATLSSVSDEDWFAITISGQDMGKQIAVQTTGIDRYTDTVVDILDDQGNSLGGPSDDQGYLDTLTSDPLTKAGTYFVKISASSYFDSAHKKYDLVIRLQ
jgi:hypothetical protein